MGGWRSSARFALRSRPEQAAVVGSRSMCPLAFPLGDRGIGTGVRLGASIAGSGRESRQEAWCKGRDKANTEISSVWAGRSQLVRSARLKNLSLTMVLNRLHDSSQFFW